MKTVIALAGNPNCGKTTLFNTLTGSSQYVGNWPGVTVEKKEGQLKGRRDVVIQDLPGIYSLSPNTIEERIASSYLVNEKVDAIINILDGTNLERNLYLTTQLLELGIPMVIAINMIDVVRKNGDIIDVQRLSSFLGCEVIEMSALKGEGALAAAQRAIKVAQTPITIDQLKVFPLPVEQAVEQIETLIHDSVEPRLLRWYASKLFEREPHVADSLRLDKRVIEKIESIIVPLEHTFDDDAESIIASGRYAYIGKIVEVSLQRKRISRVTISDKIDKIVTNKFLAIPIFAVVMFLVYFISISTVGAIVTDWTNDVLFGKLIYEHLRTWLASIGVAGWLVSLVVDGIVGGVGAVLGFVPQMAMLFLMLALLEDVGYMARIAYIMDRMFRSIGLSGKSFIPMLISSGCAVPGIMASRTIEHQRERRMTVMLSSFVPCGAKLPIIALFAGALFRGSGLVATSAYFIGISAIVISGIILKKTKLFAGDSAPFVIELPSYHVPSAKNILHTTWERSWGFILRAGTVILASSVVLWFLQSFGVTNGAFVMVEDNTNSLLAYLGTLISPIFKPLGFGFWEAAVATFTGFIAKENIVGTFGILYGFAEVAEDGREIWSNLLLDFNRLSAYSFMIFNLLCAPCFAAIGAIRREMNNAKWTWGTIGYMTGFAYVISLIVYQLGILFAGHGFSFWTAVAFLFIVFLLYMLFRRPAHYLKAIRV